MTISTRHTKWAHISDVHLDFLQYNLEERRNDFYKSWMWCIHKCIEEEVDFVVIAGDLFHNRQARHIAIEHAIEGLKLLKEHGIPTYAIIGNHELRKFREILSAPELLASQNMLTLIESEDEHHVIDHGVVVWGLDWRGAKTQAEVERFVQYIIENQKPAYENCFQVLVLHCGLLEEASEFDSSVFSYTALEPVYNLIDYVALGHIHRPYTYQLDDGPKVVNPGSTETNSFTESLPDWTDRGFYIVETNGKSLVDMTLHIPPRRDFISLHLDVSGCDNNREVGELMLSQLPEVNGVKPIFRTVMDGLVGFDLDRQYLEELMPSDFCLNGSVVKDKTVSSDFQIELSDEQLGTTEVEVKAINTVLPDYSVDYVRRIMELAVNRADTETIIKEL